VGPRDRHLFVGAGLGRPGLGHAVEEHAERDASFETGEARARAHVGTAAERDVPARVGPVEAEGVRILEHRVVAVRREDAERHLVARVQLLAVQLALLHAVAEQEPDGRIVAQRLLDRDGHEVAVGAQPLVQRRVVRDRPEEVPDEVARGLVARDEQEHELGARLDVGEDAAVDLALQEARDEVVARVVAPLGDQGVDVVRELRVRAGQPDTAVVAVGRRPRALDDLVGPCRPELEVVGWCAEQVRDDVVRHRHHVVVHEVERVPPG